MRPNTVSDETSSKSGAFCDAVNYVAHKFFTTLNLHPLGECHLPSKYENRQDLQLVLQLWRTEIYLVSAKNQIQFFGSFLILKCWETGQDRSESANRTNVCIFFYKTSY